MPIFGMPKDGLEGMEIRLRSNPMNDKNMDEVMGKYRTKFDTNKLPRDPYHDGYSIGIEDAGEHIPKACRSYARKVVEGLKYKSAIYQYQWKFNERIQAEIDRLKAELKEAQK